MAYEQDNEQLAEDYQLWHRQYRAALSCVKSDRLCKYSPTYDQLFDQLWTSLDRLEVRRASLGDNFHAPEFLTAWLDDIKELREGEDIRRRERYSTWAENSPDWKACPLWLHLCRLDGSAKQIQEDEWRRCEFPWRSTMEYWIKFQESMDNEAFRSSLSPPQQCSYQILIDWWNSFYSDPTLVEAVRAFLESRKDISYDDGGLQDIRNINACREWTDALVLTKVDMSLYHSFCFHTFLKEFHPCFWEPYQTNPWIIMLQGARLTAGSHAVAQRVAHAALELPHNEQNHTTTPYCWPRINFNSWFDTKGNAKPYYLWSIMDRRTVVVADLDYCPDYTCISHTWGRWRVPREPDVDAEAIVEGVPWMVPRNILYDVCDLPEMFLKLGDTTKYLWFDLVCIPQDGSKRADIEISRQSDIFRGATTCIAWFHDVESWEGLLGALEWRALGFLQTTTRDDTALYPDASDKVEEAAAAAEKGIELVATDEDARGQYWISPWFSSLWTLQETIMRPDLQLYSRDWQRLEDKKSVTIPLHALIIAIDTTRLYITTYEPLEMSMVEPMRYRNAMMENPGDYPGIRSSTQLEILVDDCQLRSIITSPAAFDVLELSSRRECTDQRAPGIMSALQCTDWYVKKIDENEQEKQLQPPATGDSNMVLGMFPIEFVKELFQKFGPELFLGINFMWRPLESGDLKQPTACGSMLPFYNESSGSHSRTDHHRVHISGPDLKQHISLDSWEICADGSIEMRSAGIVASTEVQTHNGALKPRVSLRWLGNYIQRTATDTSSVRVPEFEDIDDFEAWMKASLHSLDELYAVALCEDTGGMQGVLLQSPKLQETSTDIPKYLIKVGVWSTPQGEGYTVPDSTDVNWIVL